MEPQQVLTADLIEKTLQRIREHGLPRLPVNTFSPEQIEEALRHAGHIPDYRRENGVLARAFWQENWHRGFWPSVRVLV
jgi:hypothetical protein